MGESKRRKAVMGLGYGDPAQEVVFMGFNRAQMKKAFDFTMSGTWVCISGIAVFWVIFRVGVWQGWWGH